MKKNKIPLRSIDDRWETDEYILIQFDENGKIAEQEITIWDSDRKVNFKALVLNKDAFDIPQLLIDYVCNGKVKINRGGAWQTWVYFENNIVHRTDGPALISRTKDGKYQSWFKHGLYHREDGPARTTPSVNMWYIDGAIQKTECTLKNLPEELMKDSSPKNIDPETGLKYDI